MIFNKGGEFRDMRQHPPTPLEHPGVEARSSALEERLVFIDFRSLFMGELRRTDLMTRFGIGSAAATRDIAHYRKTLGGKIELDSVSKVYRPTAEFLAIYDHDIERSLMALSRGFGEGQASQTRPLISSEVPPQISAPSVAVVAPITRAINQGWPVEIRYSSFSSGEGTREIVPFALANNGLRWHVRAFDRRGQRFIDLVLTRVHEVHELRGGRVEEHERPQHDLEWGRVIELELVAHPKERHPDIVAMDYKMKDGVARVRVRAALASYLLRQWIVDCSPDHSLEGQEFRLWLRNARALYGIANARLAPGYRD